MIYPRRQGRSRLFNGSAGWYQVASADMSYASPYLTMFCRYKATQLVPDACISRWAAGTNDWLINSGAGGYWSYGFGNQSVNGATGKILPGKWQTVAMTKNGSGGDSIRGYVDGILDVISTTATAASCGNSSTFEIGRAAASSTLTFFGYICDVAVWKRALTDQEILWLHMGLPPGEISPQLLLGWWPLDGPHMWSAERDWSGRNKHASYNATVALSNEYPLNAAMIDMAYDLRNLYTTDGGGVAPVNTVAPVASGTPEVGQTLSCTTGTWTGTPAPTYTYQWQYNDGTWNNIAGATSSTWVVDISGLVDVGDSIRCVVTGTNGSGSASANSNTITGTVTVLSLDPHRSMIALG